VCVCVHICVYVLVRACVCKKMTEKKGMKMSAPEPLELGISN
jgi:hypothetical protein